MSRTHGESTRKKRIHLIPSHQPAGSRTESVQGSQRDPRFTAPPFCRYSQVIAVYDGGFWRKWMVRGDVLFYFCFLSWALPVFSSCSGFSVVLAFFGIFGISQIPGFVRWSLPAPSWHSLDGNPAIWVVRGSPPVVSWHTLDGNPAISRRGPALRALARQEHLGSAVPLGLPFDLNYQVYASTSSVASGALR